MHPWFLDNLARERSHRLEAEARRFRTGRAARSSSAGRMPRRLVLTGVIGFLIGQGCPPLAFLTRPG